MPFTSDTEQIQSPHAHTFTALAVDSEGACYASERKGLRKTKKKGFVVRYPNPFATDDEPEVLFETTEPLSHLWRSPSGALHAVGKRYHHDVSGTWKSSKLGNGDLDGVWGGGSDEDVFLASYFDHKYALYRGAAKSFARCEWFPEQQIVGMLVRSGEDIFIAGVGGLHHYDGDKLTTLSETLSDGRLCRATDNSVYSTCSDGDILLSRSDGAEFHTIVRRKDTLLEAGDSLSSVGPALGELYAVVSHGYSRGLYRVSESKIEHVMHARGYCNAMAGSDTILWVSNGIELLAYNGDEWKSVIRVLHDA